MIAPAPMPKFAAARFRVKVLAAIMVVACTSTAVALFFTQRNLAASVERDARRQFEGEWAALNQAQLIRQGVLLERCRALVRKPRIHAALEDGALDLLYPSARDELRDVIAPAGEGGSAVVLHADFYRFLDRTGAPIPPVAGSEAGELRPAEEAQLALPGLSPSPELGCLLRTGPDGRTEVLELVTMPIQSTETGEVIAALALGFRRPTAASDGAGILHGVWLAGELHLGRVPESVRRAVAAAVERAVAVGSGESSATTEVDGVPHQLFVRRLNPASRYPAACEVCLYPLADLRGRQAQLRWQVLGAGAALLLLGLAASHVLAGRLTRPVARLAVDSETNFVQRTRAEAALELTSGELQRAARFSADASHQLRTPVTVLRAGLEELLTHERLTAEECREISALIHQTYRLSGIIEDLLLLSRLDAGRLKLDIKPVNLSQLIAAALDDLTAVPDGPDLEVETELPDELHIAGEKRYTSLILQNLLENARKYNRPGGRIRIATRSDGESVRLTVANSGRPIPPEQQERIFERFNRGAMGENVPGYGLGLNLARELARLHQGDLRLARSDEVWTEFEVRFRIVPAPGEVAKRP